MSDDYSRVDQPLIRVCETKYRIGTSYPAIGTDGYPYEYRTIIEAKEVMWKIRDQGYESRLFAVQTIITETQVLECSIPEVSVL